MHHLVMVRMLNITVLFRKVVASPACTISDTGVLSQVMKGQSYNEKVDVFSFAVIIFELLSYRVAMAAIGDNRDLDYEAVHAHAQEVSHGFRLPLPDRWPPALQGLIRDCWAQKSSQRPSFAVIEQRLQDIQVSCLRL